MNRVASRVAPLASLSASHTLLHRRVLSVAATAAARGMQRHHASTLSAAAAAVASRAALSTRAAAAARATAVALPHAASAAGATDDLVAAAVDAARHMPQRAWASTVRAAAAVALPSQPRARLHTRAALRAVTTATPAARQQLLALASRGFFSFFGKRKALEAEYAAAPHDMDKLARLLEELNKYPGTTKEVPARVEEAAKRFGARSAQEFAALHTPVWQQFNSAVVRLGQQHTLQAPNQQPTAFAAYPTPTSSTAEAAAPGATPTAAPDAANPQSQQPPAQPMQQPQQPPQQPFQYVYSQPRGGSGYGPGLQQPWASMAQSNLGTAANPLITAQAKSRWSTFATVLSMLVSLAFLLMLGMMLFPALFGMSKGGAAGGPFGMQTKIKVVTPETGIKTRFQDVKGCDEAKGELEELVKFLRNPESFTKLGGKMPKGVLLTGPPGTGKTLLAKAVAGEAGVPFFFASGSEFEEMFVGVGAKRVRELFAEAKKKGPCIIFIDEIDAMGGRRNMRELHATRMTLNQLLTEMDGFQANDKVVVIAATNYAQAMDPALLRPGRFDKHVDVPLPDIKGRKEILDLYLKNIPRATDVDTQTLARGTPGCSGADLYNLVNTAAVRASKRNLPRLTQAELEYAKDKVLMGAERVSAIIPAEVRRVTAYHEGGHTLVAMATPRAMPIHKATIIPRGRALGLTHQLPEERNMYSKTKAELLAEMDVCMGGRVAEELVFGEDNVTTGASNDLERATDVARRMVMQWGMSDLGLVSITGEKHVDALSPELRKAIDEQVSKLLYDSHQRAHAVLKTNASQLEALAQALLKHETLNAEEIRQVVGFTQPAAGSSAAGSEAAQRALPPPSAGSQAAAKDRKPSPPSGGSAVPVLPGLPEPQPQAQPQPLSAQQQ